MPEQGLRLHADFNGLFMSDGILCLSHGDTSIDQNGNEIKLYEGMAGDGR